MFQNCTRILSDQSQSARHDQARDIIAANAKDMEAAGVGNVARHAPLSGRGGQGGSVTATQSAIAARLAPIWRRKI